MLALITAALGVVKGWFGYKASQAAGVQGAAGQKALDQQMAAEVSAAVQKAQAQPTSTDATKKALDDGSF